jgi:transposase
MAQMKIKISTLLMEAGISYNKQRLHKVGYFGELLASNPNIDEGLRALLRLCRETVVRLSKTESPLVRDPIWSWIPCAGVVSSLTRSRLQPKMTAV